MRKKENKGFALLYTALIASLLLSLSLSISYIVGKELILSSIGRESQKAFYMADSAAECALYWDFRYEVFATSTATSSPSIKCMGVNISDATSELTGPFADGKPGLGGVPTTTFKINLQDKDLCAVVRVGKHTTVPKTIIEAEGYNTSCDKKSRIRLQRAVRLRY